jgi:predicted acyltransferase (DUF342 family)
VSGKGSIRHILDAYIVAPRAHIKKGLSVPEGKDLVVGAEALIEGGVQAQGRIHIGKAAIIRGPLWAQQDVVIGSLAHVHGDVTSQSFILVQEDARVVGALRCHGSIRIIGARIHGPVEAGGDIEVRGDATTLELKAKGRIVSLPPPAGD